MRTVILSAFLLIGVGTTSTAQSLIAVDGLNGNFYSIDCSSGDYVQLGSSVTVWAGLTRNSIGEIFVVGSNLQQPGTSEIFLVDSGNGQTTSITTLAIDGISSLAFGPGDVLYATVDVDFPSNPHRYELFIIDLISGQSTRIGALGVTSVLAMDFDGSNMFLWGGDHGLHTVNLNTGQAIDVNPGFLGTFDLAKSICFNDVGVLYALDFGLWVMEPTTGVSNFVDFTYPGILGGVEYIPGPNQVMSLWQTEKVGVPTELKIRGATPNARVARVARADLNGEIRLGPTTLPPQAQGHLRMQAIDLSTCVTSNRIETIF